MRWQGEIGFWRYEDYIADTAHSPLGNQAVRGENDVIFWQIKRKMGLALLKMALRPALQQRYIYFRLWFGWIFYMDSKFRVDGGMVVLFECR